MSWSKFLGFLFAPPGTPSYEFGYSVGKALRKLIIEGGTSFDDDDSPKKETPEESFQKLAEQNKDLFGGFEERKED